MLEIVLGELWILNWAQAASLRQRGEIPGKDNKERWAGAKKGEPLSPEAQKAYDKMLEIQKERKNNYKKWQE